MGEHPETKWVLDIWMRPVHDQHFRRMIGSRTKERKPGSGISEDFSPSEILREVFAQPPNPAPKRDPIVDEELIRLRQTIRTWLTSNQRPFQVSIRMYMHGDQTLRRQREGVLPGL